MLSEQLRMKLFALFFGIYAVNVQSNISASPKKVSKEN